MVSADGARVYDDVPRPEGDGRPLLDFEALLFSGLALLHAVVGIGLVAFVCEHGVVDVHSGKNVVGLGGRSGVECKKRGRV